MAGKTSNDSGIPEVGEPAKSTKTPIPIVLDSDYKGKFIKISDGLEYALVIVPECPYEKTHKAKNSRYFWEGTEDQFNAHFRKA